jgi:flagellar motor switch/type III secretory pathway protein FliN
VTTVTRVDPRFAADPFPFAALPSFTRAEIGATARLTRVARAYVGLEAIENAATEILGAQVRARILDVRPSPSGRGADDSVGVMFAPAVERSPAARFLVELDGAMGACVAARAVRQKAPRVHDPSKIVAPAVAGAVAAILSAIQRRAHAGAPLRVVAAGPGAALARDLAAAAGTTTTATLAVTIEGEVFGARFTVPDAAEVALPRASLSHGSLVAMGDAPLALPIVIATTYASRAEVESLAPGDAFVPSDVTVTVQASTGAIVGPIAIVAPLAEVGLGADLAEGSRLVLRGPSESHSWEATRSVTTKTSSNTAESSEPVASALDDAPVVVRVELGAIEMKAREWADLGPGDVVTLGRKLGEPAILRVGGVELARGELVQVEGEMAVRILRRSGDRT